MPQEGPPKRGSSCVQSAEARKRRPAPCVSPAAQTAAQTKWAPLAVKEWLQAGTGFGLGSVGLPGLPSCAHFPLHLMGLASEQTRRGWPAIGSAPQRALPELSGHQGEVGPFLPWGQSDAAPAWVISERSFVSWPFRHDIHVSSRRLIPPVFFLFCPSVSWQGSEDAILYFHLPFHFPSARFSRFFILLYCFNRACCVLIWFQTVE